MKIQGKMSGTYPLKYIGNIFLKNNDALGDDHGESREPNAKDHRSLGFVYGSKLSRLAIIVT